MHAQAVASTSTLLVQVCPMQQLTCPIPVTHPQVVKCCQWTQVPKLCIAVAALDMTATDWRQVLTAPHLKHLLISSRLLLVHTLDSALCKDKDGLCLWAATDNHII